MTMIVMIIFDSIIKHKHQQLYKREMKRRFIRIQFLTQVTPIPLLLPKNKKWKFPVRLVNIQWFMHLSMPHELLNQRTNCTILQPIKRSTVSVCHSQTQIVSAPKLHSVTDQKVEKLHNIVILQPLGFQKSSLINAASLQALIDVTFILGAVNFLCDMVTGFLSNIANWLHQHSKLCAFTMK